LALEFKIDPEFQNLIPPLQAMEIAGLEASLKAEGCREPLIVWKDKNLLIDGHNRYQICKRESIAFKTREVEFSSRDHVKLWIETNQLGRRNLTDDQRAAIALSIQERRSALAKQERASKAGKGNAKSYTADSKSVTARYLLDTSSNKLAPVSPLKPKSGNRAAVARETKIPERKLRDLAEIKKRDPEAVTRIRQGGTTIKEEKNKIRRAERIENIAEVSRRNTTLDGSVGKFPVIYCDPPWQYDFMGVDAWRVDNHYPTMTTEQICAMAVTGVITGDAILFRWATAPKLADAMRVVDAWGFAYKTCAIWDKEWTGMGNYFRIQHELLLIATRGNIPPPKTDARPASIIRQKRSTTHSEKPEIFYEIIEEMYPELPKLELFARSRRKGWKTWGTQLEGEVND
jgi:N6-adenosine-specific RNA methylase IME4